MKILTTEMTQGFSLYLYENEKSEKTIEKYMRDVRFFLCWLAGRELNKSAVLEYKRELIEKYAPSSVNSILSSLNSLFLYLNWYDMKVKTLKIQRQLFANKDKELSRAEYERLLTAAKSKNNEQLFLLMQTVASTGIRISELSAITVCAVRTGQAEINCKGKLRQIFLPDKLCKMLGKYIKSRNIKNGSVFVTKTGKPLDRCRVWRLLKDLAASANVSKDKVFPHNLRHLFARTFYSLQKDIVRLADILGHSSVNTTRIYTTESGDAHKKQLQMGVLNKTVILFSMKRCSVLLHRFIVFVK